jgi:hypothetical protein
LGQRRRGRLRRQAHRAISEPARAKAASLGPERPRRHRGNIASAWRQPNVPRAVSVPVSCVAPRSNRHIGPDWLNETGTKPFSGFEEAVAKHRRSSFPLD